MADIVCVGQVVADILLQGICIEKLFEGAFAEIDDLLVSPGGDADNEASVLAKMGCDVKIVAAVGDDGLGRLVREELQRRGVDTSALQLQSGKDTEAAGVLVFDDGDHRFLGKRDLRNTAVLALEPDMACGAKVVSFASLFGPPFTDADAMAALAKAAKAGGAVICADLNESDEPFSSYARFWPYVDYFFPNEREARLFSGEDTIERAADVFLAAGVKNVIVKLGARGCYVRTPSWGYYHDAFAVDGVIDTTGAGDNFAAGFILGLTQKSPLPDCLDLANAAASICIQHLGASTGVTGRQQVYDRLAQYTGHAVT